MKFTLKRFLLFTILVYLVGCGGNKALEDEWLGTNWVQLKQENIKLRIPEQFKRSSRYRIKEDLPWLAADSIQLRLVQNSLALLEFEDAEIDVLVDTTKSYRLIIICNTAKIEFNSSDATIIKHQLEAENETSAINNPSLEYGEISATLNGNKNHRLARYTTKIQNILDSSTVYHSIYYLTGNAYTLVVYEFSEDDDLIEKYLWTTKT